MSEQFTNHSGTTLAAAITSTSRPVTFSVASATALPSTGNFRVIIGSEILLITTISGTSLTGSNVEGTTAATYAIGQAVTHVITAGALAQVELDVVATLIAQANTFTAAQTFDANIIAATASVATSGANYAAAAVQFSGSYWTGSAAASDTWSLTPTLATGSNPASTLTLAHSGAAGAAGLFAIAGLQSAGSIRTTQQGNITPTLALTGATGSTTYSYVVIGYQADGVGHTGNSQVTTGSGNATLSGTNYITVNWTANASLAYYVVYRNVSGGSGAGGVTGVIATLPAGSTTLADTGLTSSGGTANGVANTTGFIGIGQATPAAGLDVLCASGNSSAARFIGNSSSSGVTVNLDSGAGSTAATLSMWDNSVLKWQIQKTTGQTFIISDYVASQTVFSVGSNSGTMQLMPSGRNVLIGTATDSGQKLQINGSVATLALATPGAPTVTPTGAAGSTNYSYVVVANQSDGSYTVASAAGSTSTGNATLSGSNYNALSWSAVTGAYSYSIYRTVGGAAQGKISTAQTGLTLNDTGLTASGSAPTSATTGAMTVAGPVTAPSFAYTSSTVNGAPWYGIGQTNVVVGGFPSSGVTQIGGYQGVLLQTYSGTISLAAYGNVGIANTNPGSLFTVGANLFTVAATSGNTAVAGTLTCLSLDITAGSNTKTGSGTLAAGTVTISNTSITANSKIFITPTSNSANSGALAVTTKTAATSFVVKSSNSSDTSTFDYFILETA